jgi:hypothetical protein
MLNPAEIEKYAARLHGQRLLPVLREWQLKRAIRRLATDGTRPALDALKRGVEKGLLGKPPYSALLEFVLAGSVAPADAKRVRAHLRPPEPIKQPEPSPRPRPQRDWSSGVGMGTPAPPPVKAEPQRFSTTNNPIQLLQEQLKTSAPLDSYRIELRERVRQDNSRTLLQEICELWDRSVGLQKETLRELIAFIELVPERPLWLRRNVALDCGMPWQLADDSPAIVHHLVDTIQLRTRKLAILSACSKLRREDTKAEICDLWFAQYKKGVHNADFDDVLIRLGFLPKEPLEQRVAIALLCDEFKCLTEKGGEAIKLIEALQEHPYLGLKAKTALAFFRTLESKLQQDIITDKRPQVIDSIHCAKDGLAQEDKQAQPSSNEALPPHGGTDSQIHTSKNQASGQEYSEHEWEDEVCNPNQDTIDKSSPGASSIDTNNLLGKSESNHPEINTKSVESPADNNKHARRKRRIFGEGVVNASLYDPNHPWIQKLDRYVRLEPSERAGIIRKIARSDRSIDDWIEELLYDNGQQPIYDDVSTISCDFDLPWTPSPISGLHAASSAQTKTKNESPTRRRNELHEEADDSSHCVDIESNRCSKQEVGGPSIAEIASCDKSFSLDRNIEDLMQVPSEEAAPPFNNSHKMPDRALQLLESFSIEARDLKELYQWRMHDELVDLLAKCKWQPANKLSSIYKCLARMGASSSCPPELLELVAKKGDAKAREAVAANSNAHIDTLEKLIHGQKTSILRAAAINPSLDDKICHELLLSRDKEVAKNMAAKQHISLPVIDKLLGLKDNDIAAVLAQNPSVPADVLEILSDDLSLDIALGVIRNPSTRQQTLERYYQCHEPEIRRALASNSRVHESLVNKLIDDNALYPWLALNSSIRPDVLESIYNNSNLAIHRNLAKNESLPAFIREKLRNSELLEVRLALSCNNALKEDEVSLLAMDKCAVVRRQVATHTSCPMSLLLQLAQDSDRQVRERVAMRSDIATEVAEMLINDKDAGVRFAIAENTMVPDRLFHDKQFLYYYMSLFLRSNRTLHAKLLLRPSCPQVLLKNYRCDHWDATRIAQAWNPRTPLSIVRVLAMDCHKDVKAIARARLELI